MKKSINAFLCVLFASVMLSSAVQAQSWSRVYTNSTDVGKFCETSAKNIFAMRGSNYLLKSSNNGASWVRVIPVSGYPTTNYNTLAAYQNNLYLTNFSNSNTSYKGKGFYISTDQGLNWVQKNNGLGNDTTLADIQVMSNGTIFVTHVTISGANEVFKMYRSSDNGNNWTFIKTMTNYIESLVETSNGTYFATIGLSVFKSTNSGVSWTTLPQNDPVNPVLNGQVVVASNDSLYMDSQNLGLIRSLDGIHWTVVPRTGWPGTEYSSSFVITPNDTMFACLSAGATSTYGVYMSPNKGKTWVLINTGLPSTPQILYYQFWLSHNSGYLFAGMSLADIYRTTAPVYSSTTTGILSPVNYSDKYALTVSPNPAVQVTNIEYSLPTSDLVTIELLDQSGRVVKNVLTNTSQAAGTHKMQIDVSGVQAGLYILSVRTSIGGSVKKVVVN